MRAAHLLFEHILINPPAVDQFVGFFAAQVTHPAAKTWFKKTLRTFIFNNEGLLKPVPVASLQAGAGAVARNVPQYVLDAAAKGDPIFAFDAETETIDEFEGRIKHIVDWFNALTEVAAKPATNPVEVEDQRLAEKILSKLSRITPDVVTQQADRWFNHMGTRIQASKEGVKVLHRWPEGLYAVQYTDRETMRRDGKDLQNCLQHGYYWEGVGDGRRIIGIRKANDEAVVGMRIEANGELAEVKGKNNQPVGSAYHKFVVDLLNRLGDVRGTPSDLQVIGVSSHKGKYGTLEEVAVEIYNQGDIRIRRADRYLLIDSDDNTYEQSARRHDSSTLNLRQEATVTGKTITRIDFDDLDRGLVLKILNVIASLGFDFSTELVTRLESKGLFYGGTGFGTLEQIGTAIGGFEDFKLYRLGRTNTYAVDDDGVAKITIAKKTVVAHPDTTENVAPEVMHRAIAYLARTTKAVSINNGTAGEVKLDGKLLLSLDDLVERYTGDDDAAYVGIAAAEEGYRPGQADPFWAFIKFHVSHGQKGDPAKLFRTFRPKKPFKAITVGEGHLYDLRFPQINLILPNVNSLLAFVGAYDGTPYLDRVRADSDRTAREATKFVRKTGPAKYTIHPHWERRRDDSVISGPHRSSEAAQQINIALAETAEKLRQEAMTRKADPNVGISSRFATLNTKRKLGI